MPILVRHVPSQKLYVFLGPAYGMAKTNRNNLPLELGHTTSENKLLAVADVHGEISWLPAVEVLIESVDGRTCREILTQQTGNE